MNAIIDLSNRTTDTEDYHVLVIESEYQSDFLAVTWDGGKLFLSLELAREIGRTVERHDLTKAREEEHDIIDDIIEGKVSW